MGGSVYCNRLCVDENNNSVYYNWLDAAEMRGYVYNISNISGTNNITVKNTYITNGTI